MYLIVESALTHLSKRSNRLSSKRYAFPDSESMERSVALTVRTFVSMARSEKSVTYGGWQCAAATVGKGFRLVSLK